MSGNLSFFASTRNFLKWCDLIDYVRAGLMMLLATCALSSAPTLGLAQNAPSPQAPPDPQMIQAQLRQELGKAIFEAGQFQAQVAQLSAAVAKAQASASADKAYWAEYVKGLSPATVSEAKPAEQSPPRPRGPQSKP